MPFIIDNDPFLLDTFTSNIFRIEKVEVKKYDADLNPVTMLKDNVVMCDGIKEKLEEYISKKDLKNKIFNIKEPALEKSSAKEETVRKAPTLEDLLNNMKSIENKAKKEAIKSENKAIKKCLSEER